MSGMLSMMKDLGISIASEGHRHYGEGWVNVPCPWCTGSSGWHMGLSLPRTAHCYRCGNRPLDQTIARLANVDVKGARALIRKYLREGPAPVLRREGEIPRPTFIDLPMGALPLSDCPRHQAYLEGRGFDPMRLERLYGLLGTGLAGPDALRVIAPVYLDGQLVSFQGRDITGKSSAKYKACPKEKEIVCHKDTLYGVDLVPGDQCVIVEGTADAWRFGPGAVATFGVEWTQSQVAMVARKFRSAVVAYDNDKAGELRGKALMDALAFVGVEAERVLWPSSIHDPGEMSQDEADETMMCLMAPFDEEGD